MPRSMFPEISIGPRMEKGLEDQGEHIKNYGQQVMSVRTSEGFVRKSTWHVADVRRSLCQHPTSSKQGTTCASGRMMRTVQPETHSELIPWARKIEFESCK